MGPIIIKRKREPVFAAKSHELQESFFASIIKPSKRSIMPSLELKSNIPIYEFNSASLYPSNPILYGCHQKKEEGILGLMQNQMIIQFMKSIPKRSPTKNKSILNILLSMLESDLLYLEPPVPPSLHVLCSPVQNNLYVEEKRLA